MSAKDPKPGWTGFADVRGIDIKYQADRARAAAEFGETEIVPKRATSDKDPDGDLEAPASGNELRHYPTRQDPDPAGGQGGTMGGRRGTPDDNAASMSILHPDSPREDEQFAALHEKQDALLKKDSRAGATGDTDPKANAKPPHAKPSHS